MHSTRSSLSLDSRQEMPRSSCLSKCIVQLCTRSTFHQFPYEIKHKDKGRYVIKDKHIPDVNWCHVTAAGALSSCSDEDNFPISANNGYLSSALTDAGPGTSRCPWLINQGKQTVNLTLFGFTGRTLKLASPAVCYEVAVLEENAKRTQILHCAGDSRQKHVYTSTGDPVAIYFTDNEFIRSHGTFLLQFQGTFYSKL